MLVRGRPPVSTVESPTDTDAVARYCAASTANDIEGILATLSPDAELVSPLSANIVVRGKDDLRVLLGAVYSSLDGLRWERIAAEGKYVTAVATSRLAGLRVDDAMIFELGPDGGIVRIRPHLRPWLGTTAFALLLGAKLAGHFDVILRAARAGTAGRSG